MGLTGPITHEWFERATNALVLGVSSQFRYWGDEDTLVIDRGEGAYLWDMDGNRYIDYRNGFGPVIIGHGHPAVAAAVAAAAADGTTFALTSRREVEAAEAFKLAVPWVDSLRFSNTGTEVTMHALRLARGYTGREVVLKFEGQYHGVHDSVMFSTAGAAIGSLGSRRDPIPVQSSSGIPEAIRSTIRTLPYNDLEAVERLFRSEGGRIAAIIVEPILGNCFSIMPEDGFLDGLRRICDEYGTVLIFDEVKTGFRIGLGGAGEYFGVTPDLGTFAKSMGNGFPVAAIAGRDEVIQALQPGKIAQAGTYSGNGVAVAAALATIGQLATGEPFRRIDKAGTTLMGGITAIFNARGIPHHITGVPAMFGLTLADTAPRDFRDTAHHDADLYEEIMLGCIRRGVFPETDGLEPWFVSAALSDDDVDMTLTVLEDAVAEATG